MWHHQIVEHKTLDFSSSCRCSKYIASKETISLDGHTEMSWVTHIKWLRKSDNKTDKKAETHWCHKPQHRHSTVLLERTPNFKFLPELSRVWTTHLVHQLVWLPPKVMDTNYLAQRTNKHRICDFSQDHRKEKSIF